MNETLSPEALLRLRMLALGLTGSTDRSTRAGSLAGAARIAATAQRMLAVQGQDWRSARWALGLRTPGTVVDDVHEAFNSGAVVRSWPMRGTLHLVPAEDIGWMQSVTNRRVLAGAAKRREFLGLSNDTLDLLVETSIEGLKHGASLDRDELATIWTEAGIEWKSNWRYHLIWWLCQNGHAVLGPVSAGGEPRLVSAHEWIAAPRDLTGEDALTELAARYSSPRGAVSARDFAWWAGLTAGEAKRGLSLATDAGRLTPVQIDSTEHKPVTLWADPAMLNQATRDGQPSQWLLLPAFDEHLLGYQNRDVQLDPNHFERIVPGRNGMFLATVVRDGHVVGTWKRGTRKGQGLVGTALPGEALDAGLADLQLRTKAWIDFHGLAEAPFTLTQT